MSVGSADQREEAPVNSERPDLAEETADGPRWTRTVCCLCFEVYGRVSDQRRWRAGPLPIPLPDGRQADRAIRATYFNERAADALYGLAGTDSAPTRWHSVDADAWTLPGSLLGLELLQFSRYTSALSADQAASERTDRCRYLAVVHLSLPPGSPIDALAAAVRLDPLDPAGADRRAHYAGLFGPGFEIAAAVRRAFSVVMLTWAEPPALPADAPREWAAADAWLWAAASATPFVQVCPDVADPHLLDGLIFLSSSWRALALRDGVSFFGLKPEEDRSGRGFFDWAECYMRSLYTDAVLLGALERNALDDFANRLARIGNRFEKSVEFRSLVNEVTEFRNVFWWEDVTRHGPANEILRQLHNAHHTPQLFARVVDDLEAFRQQVEAQALEASLSLQMAEERRARFFEHSASIAAIAFALPVLIFAALAVPIRGVTANGRDVPAWLVVALGLGSVVLGAGVGALANWWLLRARREVRRSNL